MSDEQPSRRYLAGTSVGCLAQIVIPSLVGLAMLIVEYGFVQPASQSWPRMAVPLQVTLITAVVVVAARLIQLWVLRDRYVRETFALAVLAADLLLVLIAILSLTSGILPWTLRIPIQQFLSSGRVKPAGAGTADYLLLFIAIGAVMAFLRSKHRSWTGQQSVRQHQHAELHERQRLLDDASAELWRLAHLNPPFPIYRPSQINAQPIMPEQTIESLSWRSQARELVMLTNASYNFDREADWHDAPGCWLGKNVHSDALVLLYPARNAGELARLHELVQYGQGLARRRAKELDEVVLAIQEGSADAVPDITDGTRSRVETLGTLLSRIANFADYRYEINRRVSRETLPESPLTIDRVYVPPRIRVSAADAEVRDLEECLRDWLAEPGRRHLAILGDYGQGKSTAALVFVWQLLQAGEVLPARVPLLIELRGKNLRHQEPAEILGQWGGRYGISGQALLRLHEAGRLVLIFEGFDEMAQLADYETRRTYFKALWAFSAYPEAKIVITGRPNLFESREEMEAALGLRDPFPGEAFCQPVQLVPFNVNQIRRALRCQPTAVRAQITNLVKESPQFRDIVSRPSLLHIVSVLWEKERLADHVSELTSAYVMKMFIRNSYTRQVAKERSPFQVSSINSVERAYFMSGVATCMGARGMSNIGGSQLDEQIDRLLIEIPRELSRQESAIADQPDIPLRQRLEDPVTHEIDPRKAAQVRTDVRTSGLLVADPATHSAFRFGHKSFMEYLFAEVVAERIREPKSRRARAILSAVNASIGSIQKQPAAQVFLAELLSSTESQDFTSARGGGVSEARRAQQLLDSLLHGEGRPSTLERASLTLSVLYRAILQAYPVAGRLVLFGTLVLIAVLFSMVLGPSIDAFDRALFGPLKSAPALVRVVTALFMLLVVLSVMTSSVVLVLRRWHRGPDAFENGEAARLRLWNSICEQWCISDTAMHMAIWSFILPWVRSRPFVFFLSRQDRSAALVRRAISSLELEIPVPASTIEQLLNVYKPSEGEWDEAMDVVQRLLAAHLMRRREERRSEEP